MTRREMFVRSVAATTLGFGRSSFGGTPALHERGHIKDCWPIESEHLFRHALEEGLGFSFIYDTKKVGAEIPAEWEVSNLSASETMFRHSSGLMVTRETVAYPEFEAVEYSLRFKNLSRSPLPMLTAVNAMDLSFGAEVLPGASVLSSGGGGADSIYPPKDYALTRSFFGRLMQFGPTMPKLTLTTKDGNSSAVNLPFFFIENQDQAAGIFVGIGWTGNWRATIQTDYDRNTLNLQGGVPDLRIELQPGEEISSPSILMGAYRGGVGQGAQRLRRLLRDHVAPGVAGQRLVPPILYTTWFDIGCELDAKLFMTLVDNAAEIGQEIIMMDAGWYHGVIERPYSDMQGTWNAISNPLGNWEEGEEKTRFPSLRALGDYVRSKGMQFGLWFEPERAGPDSVLAKQHPDWLVDLSHESEGRRRWKMVYFGHPEVPEYFCTILDRYIKECGLRYIRWDQNNELLPYCQKLDAPNRRGLSQIRHLEGMHRVEDSVREYHPEVILESCAGGGERIDLATLRRRQTIWVSDQTMDPDIVRFHLEGLNHFVPGNALVAGFSPPTSTYEKPGYVFKDIDFQSYFGGAFGSAGRLHEWPAAVKAQMRKHVDAYKKIRKYLAEDFYLLLPQPRDLWSWEAWQFHHPEADEGFVQVFRIRSAEPAKNIVLAALDPHATYRFTDIYTGESMDLVGSKALSEGARFELPLMSSKVMAYQRLR